jgi:hypothetical protein
MTSTRTLARTAGSCSRFLAPDLEAGIAPFLAVPAAVAELSFVAWLLVQAVRVPEPDAPVPATA